jgi:hypothetical protein
MPAGHNLLMQGANATFDGAIMATPKIPPRRCGLYLPGYEVHLIPLLGYINSDEPKIPGRLVDAGDDGIIVIEFDNEVRRHWNHEPELLAELAGRNDNQVALQERGELLGARIKNGYWQRWPGQRQLNRSASRRPPTQPPRARSARGVASTGSHSSPAWWPSSKQVEFAGYPRGVLNLRRNPGLSPHLVLDPFSTRELNCAPHNAGFEAVPSALDTDLPHSSGRTSCRQSMGVPESRIAASLMASDWRRDFVAPHRGRSHSTGPQRFTVIVHASRAE